MSQKKSPTTETEATTSPATSSSANGTQSRSGDPRHFDTVSICSTASAFSNCPDRHGFYGGIQFSLKPREPLSRAQIFSREKKWLHMMDHWAEYMNKNYKKIRERCRKGIPSAVRPKAWFYLSGGHLLLEKYPNLYHELLRQPGNPQILEDIRKDRHRQFPQHEMFMDEEKPGQQELFNLLKAYSILNPKVGYCQAQGPIGAFLLMHMPSEQAFWCFVSVCDKYLQDYFTPGMEMLQRDASLFTALLKKVSPGAYRHLVKHKVDPLLYMTDWFLCCMTRTLPWDTLLRIWDCFLCEGIKIIFKVALVIVSVSLSSQKVKKQCNGLCETLEVLKNPNEKYVEENFLMENIFRLNITVEDFITEHKKIELQQKKLKSQQQQQK